MYFCSFFFLLFFPSLAGLECQNERGRDLHADLRAGSNRLISNRFGSRRVSPRFSPFLHPLPSSPIHVQFSCFLFRARVPVAPFLSPSVPFIYPSLCRVLALSFARLRRVTRVPPFSAISSDPFVGFLQSRHRRDYGNLVLTTVLEEHLAISIWRQIIRCDSADTSISD